MNITQTDYSCGVCNYHTTKISSYQKHMYSWKHLKKVDALGDSIDGQTNQSTHSLFDNTQIYVCRNCSKKYKTRSGYFKHERICNINRNTSTHTNSSTTHSSSNDFDSLINGNYTNDVAHSSTAVPKDILITMMKYMNETGKKHDANMEKMQKQLEEERQQSKLLMNTIHDMIPQMGNFNNNQININFFLKEQCKDALNLRDFVESLRIELNDITKFQNRSMIDALGNVFVNGLRQLDLYKRPIHCMDLARETLYIKDNDAWEHDVGERDMLRSAITAVAAKQSRVLQEWERIHPDWNKSEELTNEYFRLVKATTCPIEKGSTVENKIIHNIAKEVVVDLKKS